MSGGERAVEPEVHELYIELMCKQQPENVLYYLRSVDGYRLEETLQVIGVMGSPNEFCLEV